VLATMAAFLSGQRLDGTYEDTPTVPAFSAENDGFPLEAWDGH
jgi:hypothetical protein